MSPAAAKRKAERRRQWSRDNGGKRRAQRQARRDAVLADAWAFDDKWYTLTCPTCQRLFDNPRRGGRRYTHCPECRS